MAQLGDRKIVFGSCGETLDKVQTFWWGRPLGPIELTMLRSFVRHGHPVDLYTFDEASLGEVPTGVTVRDAGEILSRSSVYFYKNNPSLSAFSNDFRFKLLHDRGGVWVDADVVCLKPMEWLKDIKVAIASEYLPTARGAHATTHFLKMPKGGKVAKRCMEVCADLKKQVLTGRRKWGLGPDTIRSVVRELNLKCLPPERTSTCPHHHFKTLVAPPKMFRYPERLEDVKADTGVVHLWHEMWRRDEVNPDAINPDSIFAKLERRYRKGGHQTVLVTGAAGFIGRNLVRRLHALGRFRVVGLDVLPRPPEVNANIDWIQEDLVKTDLGAVGKRFGVDCIVHLAGLAGVRQSDDKPRAYVHNNIDATTAVFDMAKTLGIKVVFASSSSVYGDTPPPQQEHAAIHANLKSFYALTKLVGEDIGVYYWKRHGVPSFLLRFFTVYGTHGRPGMAVRKFSEQIMDGKPVTVYGDGTQLRDFTDVRDVCTAIVKCVDDVRGGCHEFNVGAGGKISVNGLIGVLEEAIGQKATVQRLPRHPADVDATGACTERIAEHFGWRPAIGIREGVEDFVQWLSATKRAEV